MKAFTGATRLSFLFFFASHIPITLMVDGQAVLPSVLYPSMLQDLVDWYATTFQDPLMTRPFETWFSAMVCCEVFCQLPFFVVAVYMILSTHTTTTTTPSSNATTANNSSSRNSEYSYPVWFQQACIVYGSHVCTTLIPIFAILGTNPHSTVLEKIVLLGFYSPYFVFPAWLVYLATVNTTTTTTTTKETDSASSSSIHNTTVKKEI